MSVLRFGFFRRDCFAEIRKKKGKIREIIETSDIDRGIKELIVEGY